MVLSERAGRRDIRTTPSGGSGTTRERKKERCGSNLEEGRTERSRGAKEGEKKLCRGHGEEGRKIKRLPFTAKLERGTRTRERC